MKRTGMTEEEFLGILNRQMLDSEKRRRADFIIPTGLGKRIGLQYIKEIIGFAKNQQGGKLFSEKPRLRTK